MADGGLEGLEGWVGWWGVGVCDCMVGCLVMCWECWCVGGGVV